MDNLNNMPAPSETTHIYDELCQEVIFANNKRSRYLHHDYKNISTPIPRWVNKRWVFDVVCGWLSFGYGMYAVVATVLSLFVFNTSNFLTLTLPIIALFASWMSFRSALLAKNAVKLSLAYAQQKAIQFEPRGVWKLWHLPEAGSRATLINALLGARFIERVLSEATTMPVDTNATDAKVSALIHAIYESKENDIHPYLIEQVNQMCELTFKYHDMYRSLIELHFMLMESAKTHSTSTAKPE